MSDSVALHARGNPSALAVCEGTRQLTYGELDAKSNALCHALQKHGVARDQVVGLCARRSLSQLVGALGILRAGAAFLPLDPALPRDRAAFQIADASATALVLGAEAADPFAHGDRPTMCLRADGSLVVETTDAGISATVHRRPDDLAYVIYTSGSTGQPKGVEITDGALANLIRWHKSAFEVTAADRASHISSVGFDAAVWEVWPYLSAGASVHIADDFVAKEPEALRDWLIGNGITIGFAVTPLMERLMDLPWPAKSSLRTMLTGADTLRKYPSSTLPFTLVNNYGPTEAAVVATSGIVPAAASAAHHVDRLPSIGKPIANVQLYVLDENRRPVPAGDEGEIWIAGAGLARGYVGRPDLTNERFVAFGGEAPGTRMYRTGDRGRVLPDGDIAFLGRLDEQLKVRGFRIEAGEIEAALDAHPAILESAVVVRDVAPGDERLVAYVALRAAGAGSPNTGQIRQFLTTRLPSYMIPSNIVRLPSLPLTSNGKFDRVALRARDADETFHADDYMAPRTPTEERLARIVAPLLKIDCVSVEDNFFLLGGHSLLGTQLIARIRDAFGVKIGLRYLFESPTIAGLALEVERLTANRPEAAGDESSRTPILKRR